MKHFLRISVLSAALTALLALPSSAHSFKYKGLYYKTTGPETVEVSYKGEKYDGYFFYSIDEAVIPSLVEHGGRQYLVTGIGRDAFRGASILRRVVIPESVTEIGWWAFADCPALKEVVFPQGLRRIGASAFIRSGLESVCIPSGIETLETAAFNSCKSLKRFEMASGNNNRFGTWDIPEQFFYDCSALEEVLIPDRTVGNVGKYAFFLCASFKGGLPMVNSRVIGDFSFAGCRAMKGVLNLPSAETIGEAAFSESSIEEFRFSDHLKALGPKSLFTLGKIEMLFLPRSVELVGKHAFSSYISAVYCDDSLTSVWQGRISDMTKIIPYNSSYDYQRAGEVIVEFKYNQKLLDGKTDPHEIRIRVHATAYVSVFVDGKMQYIFQAKKYEYFPNFFTDADFLILKNYDSGFRLRFFPEGAVLSIEDYQLEEFRLESFQKKIENKQSLEHMVEFFDFQPSSRF